MAASCPFTCRCRMIVKHHHQHNRSPPLIYSCTATTATNQMTFCFSYSSSYRLNHHPAFPPKRNLWSGYCHATGPQSDPPSGKHLFPISGVAKTFTRFQDTLRIFFAVLFWMSLFFWSSIWDGGNGGKPDKQSQFRK